MNEEIHNPRIANLQVSADDYEKAIIRGDKFAHDLNEFNVFYQELKDLLEEYKTLYLETKGERSRQMYDKYLSNEIDFLNLMNEIMMSLEASHDVVGFVEGREIQKEWEQARVIITYRNIERKLSILTHLNKAADATHKKQYQNLMQQHEFLRPKVIEAAAAINEKSMAEYNTMEVTTLDDRKKNFYSIDFPFYNTLSNTIDKIKYISLILDNIVEAKGKKTFVACCGVQREIATKHVWRYRQYMGMLKNLEMKSFLEEKKNVQNDKNNENYLTNANQYASLMIALYKLGLEAIPALENAERVTTVASFDGKPLTILKSRVEKFNELIGKYQELKDLVPNTSFASALSFLENSTQYQQIENQKEEILQKKQFLDNQNKKDELINKVQRDLGKELCDLYYVKKFVDYVMLKFLFKSSGVTEEKSISYATIMNNLDYFMYAVDYTEEAKKKILNDILLIVDAFPNKVIVRGQGKVFLPLPVLEEENSKFLQDLKSKVLQAQASFIREGESVIRYKEYKVLDKKPSVLEKLKRKSSEIAASLGMTVFVGTTSFLPSINKKSLKDKFVQKPSSTNVDNSFIKEEISRETQKTMLEYNYNGVPIYLDPNSIDFEAKKIALEANGAILITEELTTGRRGA